MISIRWCLISVVIGYGTLLTAGTAWSADDDPFAPKKGTKAEPRKQDPVSPLIDFKAEVSPKQAAPGQTVQLKIVGTPAKGQHTYPVTQRTPDWNESGLSQIKYGPSADLQPVWVPFQETPPIPEKQSDGSVLWVHEETFTWKQDIFIQPAAKPGKKRLVFHVKGQVCDDRKCVPVNYPLKVVIEVSGARAIAITDDIKKRLEAEGPEIRVVPAGEELGPSGDTSATSAGADRSLGGFLLVSMGAAILMLFTPCVFPMIPITVSFFLKQAEKEHHKAFPTAAVYSLTIIVVLTAAVLLLGTAIIEWANDPWMNLGLGAVLVFFALSLFGMYEIELPAGLARFTAAHEGRGGYIGAFFMALTFTITSFTCTGPFLGPLLAAAREFQLSLDKLILGALVYSATFAAPFFVLALFPTLLKALPKSGAWLNAVKVVMGFLEMAAALKFLANTDLAWNPGNPMLFTYETVLCGWIALSVACGLYLFGMFRLPHDTPLENVGVVRMLLAAGFLGLGIYMVPALWRITPQGTLGQGLVAFLPLDTKANPAELQWHRDFEEAWNLAASEGKLVFIDFTGQNCTNCRYNEKNVFEKPNIRKELEKYVLVQLYTDFVPDSALSRADSEKQAKRNQKWQSNTFGDITNPFYAIIKPEKDKPPFKDSRAGQQLAGAHLDLTRKGLIPRNELNNFEQFLKDSPQKLARRERNGNGRRAQAANGG